MGVHIIEAIVPAGSTDLGPACSHMSHISEACIVGVLDGRAHNQSHRACGQHRRGTCMFT